MKQMLLVVMIHLLILHQYQKDKKEVLAPKKEYSAKKSAPKNYQGTWLGIIQPYTNDSLFYSSFPYRPNRLLAYPYIHSEKGFR